MRRQSVAELRGRYAVARSHPLSASSFRTRCSISSRMEMASLSMVSAVSRASCLRVPLRSWIARMVCDLHRRAPPSGREGRAGALQAVPPGLGTGAIAQPRGPRAPSAPELSLKNMRWRARGSTTSRMLAVIGAPVLSLGCAMRTTVSYSVHDPAAVFLQVPDGRPVVPPGPSTSPRSELLFHGEHRALFTDIDYDVFAERASDGTLYVACPMCPSAFHAPVAQRLPLVGEDRFTAPVAVDDVTWTPKAILLHERPCFHEDNKHTCAAGADAVLAIPWNDVVLVREHIEPIRWLGVVGVCGGAPVILAGALDFALSPRNAPTGLGALGLGALGAALVGAGLWYLLAPGSDDDTRAPQRIPAVTP